MSASELSLANLAASVKGKGLVCAYLTPYRQHEDFQGCQAFIEFEDDSLLELRLSYLTDLQPYPVLNLPDGCQRVESIDGTPIEGLQCVGLCVSETVYSFGLIVQLDEPMVLCLDTRAAIRLSLYLYPLRSLVLEGAKVFTGEP
ncbi:hypothetical protein BH09VER1_BH09VER1_35720 [soil metagenome]